LKSLQFKHLIEGNYTLSPKIRKLIRGSILSGTLQVIVNGFSYSAALVFPSDYTVLIHKLLSLFLIQVVDRQKGFRIMKGRHSEWKKQRIVIFGRK